MSKKRKRPTGTLGSMLRSVKRAAKTSEAEMFKPDKPVKGRKGGWTGMTERDLLT